MDKPLIVGVDGSDAALRAVDWAVAEAARHGLELRVVHGSLWEHYHQAVPSFGTSAPSGRLLAERVVASAAERAARIDPTLHVTTAVVAQDATSALLRESDAAFALVVGSRGRGGLAGMLLGSTGLEVAARARCPVVVVRAGGAEAAGGQPRVVLGVGSGGESLEAAAFAFREADARDAELLVVRGWRRPAQGTPGAPDVPAGADDDWPPEERRAARELDQALVIASRDHPKVTVRRRTPEGPARASLLAAAEGSELLVVGARRRHGSVGMQLGPVNHALLHHAPCPVAVVPLRF